MRTAKPIRPTDGFTLVEMLVVIAIIGILAAFLLPGLVGGKKRAQRILCESQLQQIGIAFQSFSHDHNSKFPMQVGMSEGGSLEFVQGGNLADGAYYFGYRHFQPLSGTLETPKLLVCPADTRLPATNFNTLQNSNLSYFAGVTAQYDQPMSILAGDGNLASSSSLVKGAAGGRLTWNRAQHEYKGNVLFADGHVEEWSDTGHNSLASRNDLVLPSLGGPPRPSASAQPNPSARFGATPKVNEATSLPLNNSTPATRSSPATMPPATPPRQPATIALNNPLQATIVVGEEDHVEVSNSVVENIAVTSNAPGRRVSSPHPEEATMSPFDRNLAGYLREFLVGAYLVILLLLLLFAAYRVRRWMLHPARRRGR